MSNYFTHDKALHSLSVANFMKTWAPKLGLNPNAAWVIGWVHDVGYTECMEGHNIAGANILEGFSDVLAHYAKVHDSKEVIQDDMEFLVHLADLVIDETGKYVGIDNRIKSINLRNGYEAKDNLERVKDLLWKYASENCYQDIYLMCL